MVLQTSISSVFDYENILIPIRRYIELSNDSQNLHISSLAVQTYTHYPKKMQITLQGHGQQRSTSQYVDSRSRHQHTHAFCNDSFQHCRKICGVRAGLIIQTVSLRPIAITQRAISTQAYPLRQPVNALPLLTANSFWNGRVYHAVTSCTAPITFSFPHTSSVGIMFELRYTK